MVKILIVDDIPDNVKLLQYCLEDEGYQIVTATNGQEALRQAAAERPDAMLLDVMMPGMDGIEVCRRIREDDLLRDMPIILVTALSQEDDIIRGLDAGADDYVTKPFNERVIAARTRSAVNRYKVHAENRELMGKLEVLARTDPLTGIMNRRTFFEHFERELSLAVRHERTLSCVLIDLDFFKKINDEHGHAIGDAVLVAVADSLKEYSRDTDLVCRYGGEEFCVLLPMANEEEARIWSQRMLNAIRELKIPAGDTLLRITASFGIASRFNDVRWPSDIVDLADGALLVANRSGRNRIVLQSELNNTRPLSEFERGHLDTPLCRATAKDVMTCPIVCMSQDSTLRRAAEMLLRFRVNSIPIVDDRNKLVGIISEKDLMAEAVTSEADQKTVEQCMSTNVVSFNEDDPAQAVHEFLCRNTIRRVVVEKDGHPTGVISRGNLLRWLNNWQQFDSMLRDHVEGDGQHPEIHPLRDTLEDRAQILVEELTELKQMLDLAPEDVTAKILGAVSRVQELSTELFALSRSYPAREQPVR